MKSRGNRTCIKVILNRQALNNMLVKELLAEKCGNVKP